MTNAVNGFDFHCHVDLFPDPARLIADCERGLGRPEKALELGRSEEARKLTGDEATELRIVLAGARMDLGQYDQAVVTLQTPDLDPERTGTPAARLFYAYADALVAAGRTEEGLQWFLHSAGADIEGVTDAVDPRNRVVSGRSSEPSADTRFNVGKSCAVADE